MPETPAPIPVDVLIFGGGGAGLWLLDTLSRSGHSVLLLEAHTLGSGQTIASQGIIHGGLKYTLTGLLSSSARAIRDMPLIWRRCLAGEQQPDLSEVLLRSEFCHLWQTSTLASRVGMLGARAGLRIGPARLEDDARPAPLRRCPGTVARLDEQVIDPASMIAVLTDRHGDRMLRIDASSGLEFETAGNGDVRLVRLLDPSSGAPLDLAPGRVVLTAGAGNEALRRDLGLRGSVGQRRPLHMVVGRGPLPLLNGHCVDGMHTRATITTARDYADRIIWQVGGQIAEDGVDLEPPALISHAVSELRDVLPRIDLDDVEWSTYRVDRAEAGSTGTRRPSGPGLIVEGSVITAWPTKLALVPQLVDGILGHLPAPDPRMAFRADHFRQWPRPEVAVPPWEEQQSWIAGV